MVILGVAPPPTRRDELAAFLRRRREATAPDAVGLRVAGPRRTPGLRREEVSQLAGVGLSWYTWLEQGRDITPSPSVLDALARLYDLDPPERRHLYDLAGVAPPLAAGPYATEAPADVRAVVEGLDPNPAYLIGPRTDVLAWNRAASLVLGDPTPAPDGVPNLLWWLFTSPRPDHLTWQDTGRDTLARFRAEHARRYEDPAFQRLIRALLARSERFRELWGRHEVQDAAVGTKRIEHPLLGPLRLHHLQSIPTSAPELRLTQLVPADERTRAVLADAVAAVSAAAAVGE